MPDQEIKSVKRISHALNGTTIDFAGGRQMSANDAKALVASALGSQVATATPELALA